MNPSLGATNRATLFRTDTGRMRILSSMGAWGFSGLGLKAAALSTVAVVSVSAGGQDQLDPYRTQMETMSPRPVMPAPSDGAIASAIAQWTSVRQTDALPFESYAGFLLAHPGWPGETAIRRAAEKAAAQGEPMRVATYFRRFPAAVGDRCGPPGAGAAGDRHRRSRPRRRRGGHGGSERCRRRTRRSCCPCPAR